MKNLLFDYRGRFIAFAALLGLVTAIALMIADQTLRYEANDTLFTAIASQEASLCRQMDQQLSILTQAKLNNNPHADTLYRLIDQLFNCHQILTTAINKGYNDVQTDSLLRQSQGHVTSITTLKRKLQTESSATDRSGIIGSLRQHNVEVSLLGKQMQNAYKTITEYRVHYFKLTRIMLGLVSLLILLTGFGLIVWPALTRLQTTNQNLFDVNKKLITSYKELQISNESNHENLKRIQILQHEITQNEKHYREIVEQAQDVIYEIDSAGMFVYINPTMEALSASSRNNLLGKPYWQIIEPSHQDKIRDFYDDQANERRESSYVEFPIVDNTGKVTWLGQKVRMFFGSDGILHRALIIARDITTLKETQQKLENSEKLYRLITTNTRDIISLFYIKNGQVIITYTSPSITEITGFKAEEVTGKALTHFIHPEDSPDVMHHLERMDAYSKPVSIAYRTLQKSGSYTWVESITQPFFNDKGKQIGYQTSTRDIAKRKEIEEKLKEAKEKAEDATRAKSQFLSMMSHEIRTPMNGVIGLTNFLLEEQPRYDQMKHLNLLKFSSENLMRIINDILDFSKIEAGKISLESIPFDLRNLIESVISTLKVRASEKSFPLLLTYDEQIPAMVTGDPVRLSQVLNNLVGNAVKFTAAGFVNVSVKLLHRQDNICMLEFSIADTGIGIPRDKIETVFELFTQAQTNITRKYGGTGLGLAITKKLLALMNTDITVESEPGKGSTFRFNLALEAVDSVQEDSAGTSAHPVHVASAHILLVEDNDVNQVVAVNFLHKWGFTVTVASNGAEAVERIQQQCFHLVLMDLQMPVMHGYEATQKIRAMAGNYFQDVPIIALTASASLEDLKGLVEIGITDYVSKPFNVRELEEKIFNLLLPAVPKSLTSTQQRLDKFSDSNPRTNVELAKRIIDNIHELREALHHTLHSGDHEIFKRATHKMKTAVGILKDQTLTNSMHEMRDTLRLKSELTDQVKEKAQILSVQCEDTIHELTAFIHRTKD